MKRRILPPTYFFMFLLIGALLHYIVPVAHIIKSPYTYLGAIGVVFGILLNLWADSLFKKEHTTVKPYERPSALITSGPFRISRHPMYLGMFSILFGESVLFGSAAVLPLPFVFAVLIEVMFIRREELNMELTFGKEYTVYKKNVRRWL